ncbi:MAG: DUF1134 domain-containing protein [Candidatus Competibacteraceae bacterium]|nr:DUF1134 domain-containing protein [Candidatus Competibacteraceae bacterium]
MSSVTRSEEILQMSHYRKFTYTAVLVATVLASGLALAADTAKKPSGKVTVDETQFGLILGGSVGEGNLTFEGKRYPFKIDGLSAGAHVGVAKTSAVGEVYNLQAVPKFPGTYTRPDANVALGGGVGGLQMQNEQGVIMRLESRTQACSSTWE